MRSRTVLLLLVIALIIVFVSTYNFPKKVDVSRNALSIIGEKKETASKVAVEINGTLYRSLFREWSFKGKISIESYPYTVNHDMMDLQVNHKKTGMNLSTLVYLSSDNKPDLGADLKFNSDFSVFSIVTGTNLIDGNRNPKSDTLTITYPAKDYEQALETQEKIRIKAFP